MCPFSKRRRASLFSSQDVKNDSEIKSENKDSVKESGNKEVSACESYGFHRKAISR